MIVNLPVRLTKQTTSDVDAIHMSSGHPFFKKLSQNVMHLKIPICAVLFISGYVIFMVCCKKFLKDAKTQTVCQTDNNVGHVVS